MGITPGMAEAMSIAQAMFGHTETIDTMRHRVRGTRPGQYTVIIVSRFS
jgi:hypothetical protein